MATERRNYGITSHTSIHVYADETQVDTANNRSYISTELWILGSSYSAYNVDCNVTGGGGYTNSHLSANGWVKLVSGGFWAPHNADGTGSATVGSYYSSGYGNMPYGEFTLTLTKIARASQPSINTWPNNSPDITAGVACTIHMNKQANFTHKVSYSFGKKSGVIATGVVDNCSWTPPTSLLDQISTATVGYGGISVETYSGSTKIGDTKTCNFNLHIPSNSNPTIGAITLTEQHDGVKAKNANVTVQQISKKLVSVPVSAKYSASIKTVTCDGVTLSNNNGTYTGYISNKTNGTYKVTVTDSRGLQSSNSATQTFYEYAKPFITATLKRESETSANGTLSVSGSYSTILSNTLSMTIQRNDSSSPTTVSPSLSNGNISYSKSYTDLNYVQSFTVKVKATDGFGESVEVTAVLGVGQYAFAMIKQGVVLGPDSYLFDKQNAIRSVLDFFYPVGSIYISTSSTFNPQTAWGGTWKKTADGRCLIGASDKYPLRSTGGEANHTLTEDELPLIEGRVFGDATYGSASSGHFKATKENPCNLHAGTGENDFSSIYFGFGKNLPHNNMQPYLAVYIWERTA